MSFEGFVTKPRSIFLVRPPKIIPITEELIATALDNTRSGYIKHIQKARSLNLTTYNTLKHLYKDSIPEIFEANIQDLSTDNKKRLAEGSLEQLQHAFLTNSVADSSNLLIASMSLWNGEMIPFLKTQDLVVKFGIKYTPESITDAYADSNKPIVFLDSSQQALHFYYKTPEGQIFEFKTEDGSILSNLQKVDALNVGFKTGSFFSKTSKILQEISYREFPTNDF